MRGRKRRPGRSSSAGRHGDSDTVPEMARSWRRSRIGLAALIALIALGCAEDGTEPAGPEPATDGRSQAGQQVAAALDNERPHVVLITLDTLRADRLSSFGSQVDTPHLDRLAADGVLFTNASSTVPFTLPAHSSIMTGTYPPHHGVRENVGYFLGDDNRTLAEMLGEAGWQTAGFVSAFVLDSRWGIARGFEHYFDDFDLSAFEEANLGSVQRPGPETIAAALAWLDGRDPSEQRPVFLWLHLFDPHDPYTPPEPFRSRYPGRPYEAEVAYTDALVGGFVGELEERGMLERSLVVLTADHGEGLGDHGETFHGYFVYDSTIHVPLILRLPGRAFAGRRLGDAVSHVDIAPTILELAGRELPTSLQGRSLLGLLDAEGRGDGAAETAVYAESFYPLLHYGWAPLRSLRTASHKYIEAPDPELFELASDPGERTNRFADQSRVGRQLARDLRAMAERLEEGASATTAPDIDEETLSQLRALGYLAGPGGLDARAYDPDMARADPKQSFPLHHLLMRAQSLVSAGEHEPAARLLRQALEEDPALLDAHQLLGSIELASGQPAAAAGHFERALAIDDRHRPSLFGLATSHERQGRTGDALLGYRRLLEIAGQDSKTTLAIADIEVAGGELAAAEKTLRQATLPGAPALLFNRLGEVQALSGRPAEARESFALALEGNPRLSQPHFNLAVLFEQSGDAEAAIKHYREAIDKAPRHYQAQFNLARLSGKLGDATAERELLEQSIASKPDFAMGHFFLGKSLMDGDDPDLARAEDVTRKGLEIVRDSQLGWFVLADILNRRGRPAEAQQAVATARSLAPGREQGSDG